MELIRSKAAVLGGCASTIKNILRSAPSGYNRDFQDTKEPFLKAARLSVQCARIMELTFREVEVNRRRLTEAFTPEIFATDAAYEAVAAGKSFRDAYREVGLNLGALENRDPAAALRARTSTGTPGALCLETLFSSLSELKQKQEDENSRFSTALKSLTGTAVKLF